MTNNEENAAKNLNPGVDDVPPMGNDDDGIGERVDRLSGEPAPDISPEEFARLQRGGTINFDARGRIRENRRDGSDPGVSLRKRRAWYGR